MFPYKVFARCFRFCAKYFARCFRSLCFRILRDIVRDFRASCTRSNPIEKCRGFSSFLLRKFAVFLNDFQLEMLLFERTCERD